MNKAGYLNKPEVKEYFNSLIKQVPKANNKIFPSNGEANLLSDQGNQNEDLKSNNESPTSHYENFNPNLNNRKSLKPNSQQYSSNHIENSVTNDKKRRSTVNLVKKLGEFTKNAFEKQEKEFHDEYIKGLAAAHGFLDIYESKHPLLKIFNQIFFFTFQIMMLMMNFLSVVSMVLVTDFRLGVFDQSNEDNFIKLELSIGAFFSFELIFNFLISKGGILNRVLCFINFNTISNILFITEIMTTIFVGDKFVRLNSFFIIVFIFRSLKILKVKMIFKHTWKQLKKIVINERNDIDYESQNELIYFIYGLAIDIAIGIFIQATVFMAINEIFDYDAFYIGDEKEVDKSNFDYVSSSYYAIVSLTTIGYGDIYPRRWESRLFTIFILLINMSLLSNFFSQINEKIHEISPYIRNFSYINHIVIIGNLPFAFLKYFVKEVYFADELNSKVYDDSKKKKNKQNHFYWK